MTGDLIDLVLRDGAGRLDDGVKFGHYASRLIISNLWRI